MTELKKIHILKFIKCKCNLILIIIRMLLLIIFLKYDSIFIYKILEKIEVVVLCSSGVTNIGLNII